MPNSTDLVEASPSPTPERRHKPIVSIIGWVCFAVGLLTFWIFGLGLLFLLAAFVVGMVLVVRGNSRAHLALTIASACFLPVCTVLAVILVPFLWMGLTAYHMRADITQFMRAGGPPPHHVFTGGRYLRTSSGKSPDGKTYLVIEDNTTKCGPIRIDGVDWPQPVQGQGEIAPGQHSISCDDPKFTRQFEVKEGTIVRVQYWAR